MFSLSHTHNVESLNKMRGDGRERERGGGGSRVSLSLNGERVSNKSSEITRKKEKKLRL